MYIIPLAMSVGNYTKNVPSHNLAKCIMKRDGGTVTKTSGLGYAYIPVQVGQP